MAWTSMKAKQLGLHYTNCHQKIRDFNLPTYVTYVAVQKQSHLLKIIQKRVALKKYVHPQYLKGNFRNRRAYLLKIIQKKGALKKHVRSKEWPGKTIYFNFDSIFGDFF